MKKASPKKILWLPLILILLLIGIGYFIKENLEQSFVKPDPSKFSKIYSNGWYNYSFRYPEELQVSYAGNVYAHDVIHTHSIRIRNKSNNAKDDRGCSFSIIPSGEKENVGVRVIEDNQDVEKILIHGIEWKKLKYTSNPGEFFYEYNGIIWQTEGSVFTYIVGARQDNEIFCESVLSTFKEEIDNAVPSAVEAKKVKDLVIAYMAKNYPTKRFWEGWFVYHFAPGDSNSHSFDVLKTTNGTIVVFKNPKDSQHPETTGVLLNKVNNEWVISGETNVVSNI